MTESNKNKYVFNAKQEEFLKIYLNPKSKTFGNAFQSAKKAGYSEKYAKKITSYDWFKQGRNSLDIIDKCEKVIVETLNTPAVNSKGGSDSGIMSVKLKAAQFGLETLGKNLGYTKRTETDLLSGGEKINIVLSGAIAQRESEEKENATT